MTSTQLAIVEKLFGTGSVYDTAKELGIDRTTVKRNMDQLENRLGIKLFTAVGVEVRPTVEGATLFPLFRKLNRAFCVLKSSPQAPACKECPKDRSL